MKRSFLSIASLLVLSSCFGVACGDGEPDETPASGDGDGDGDGDVGCDASQELCGDICASVNSDPAHCGECGNACEAGEGCLDGECADFGCGTGQVVCTEQCVDLQTDAAHCGDCDEACDAGQVCDDGQCEASCPPEFLLCDGECVDPLKDRDFCGATSCEEGAGAGGAGGGNGSSTVCEEGAVCFEGACTTSCPTDLLACGETCIDPLGDEGFCGATDCSAIGTSGEICSTGEECFAGTCTLNCPAGLLACDETCVNPEKDADFCGATDCSSPGTSGEVCASGEACFEGACTLECPEGLLICGDTCVDPEKDADFCGATDCGSPGTSGEECATGEACFEGDCTLECPEGLLICDDTCVNPDIDANFCGATDCGSPGTSGEVCASGEACFDGDCTLECPEGLLICGGTCVNPASDDDFCGATDCSSPGTSGTACDDTESCVAGECRTYAFEWTPGAGVDEVGATTGTNEHALGTDAQGNAIVFWRQYVGATDDANLRVFARRYVAATRAWGPATRVDQSTVRTRNLALDVAQNGQAVAAWIQEVGASTEVWMAFFDPGTTTWGTPIRADEATSLKDNPEVGIDESGNVHIVWSAQIAAANYRIVRNYYDAGSSAFTGEQVLSGYGEANQSFYPHLDVNADGDAGLIWWEGAFGAGGGLQRRVFATVYSSDTQAWSTPSALLVGAGPGDRLYNYTGQPDIGVDASGIAYAVWSQYYATTLSQDIWLNTFDGAWGTAEVIEDATVTTVHPRIAVAADGSSAVAYGASSVSTGPFDVRVSRLDSDLNYSDVLVEAAADAMPNVSVALDSLGNSHAIWGAAGHVRTSTSGSLGLWSTPISLTSTASPAATDPHVAVALEGRAYASWYQNSDIVFARYD